MMCENCGAPLREGQEICRQCGQLLGPVEGTVEGEVLARGASSCLLALCVGVLILFGAPMCLFGACLLLYPSTSGATPSGGAGFGIWEFLVGAVMLAIFGSLIWAVANLSRKQ